MTMTLLARLRRQPKRSPLETELLALEEQAATASPGFECLPLTRAGDLCVAAGDVPRGIRFYGRAIDAYLESGRWDSGAALCRKILRVSPGSVRPYQTLAWIALGTSDLIAGARALDGYVAAACRNGLEHRAIANLKLMATMLRRADVLEIVGERLLSLGEHTSADSVLGTAHSLRNGTARIEGGPEFQMDFLCVITSAEDITAPRPVAMAS
jgi:hypothetical protein